MPSGTTQSSVAHGTAVNATAWWTSDLTDELMDTTHKPVGELQTGIAWCRGPTKPPARPSNGNGTFSGRPVRLIDIDAAMSPGAASGSSGGTLTFMEAESAEIEPSVPIYSTSGASCRGC